jgi:hypothetical protein
MRAFLVDHIGAPLDFIAIALWSPIAGAADDPKCLAMQKAMVEGHFSAGSLICSKEDAQLGMTAGSERYSIYDYRYRFLPSGGQVLHGGQRLLVFRGHDYIGQYSMSPPPYAAVTVRGSYLVLSKEGAETVMVDFSMGPPASLYFDGETEGFGR